MNARKNDPVLGCGCKSQNSQNSEDAQNRMPQPGVRRNATCRHTVAASRLRAPADSRSTRIVTALYEPHKMGPRNLTDSTALKVFAKPRKTCKKVFRRTESRFASRNTGRICEADSGFATRDMQPSASCKTARGTNCTICNLGTYCSLVNPRSERRLKGTATRPPQTGTLPCQMTNTGLRRSGCACPSSGYPLPQSMLLVCARS